ncbi:MAG: Csp1 family four helix bundle copper storage protein [Myxococcota bacterium]|nr:Csp1 family four helix bundle copper storage protein [Myxococcota bacterium]
MSRRELLIGAGALATLAATSPALGAGRHDHATHAPRHPALLGALEACTSTGRLCVSHCLVTFREGDTSLAACAAKVHEMMAVCDALTELVAANSTHVASMASVCTAVCKECSAECEKHAEKHRECKACMEACDRLLPELAKVAA